MRVKASLRFTYSWEETALVGEGPAASYFELFRTIDLSAGGALVARHVVNSAFPRVGVTGECAFTIDSVEVRVAARVVAHRNGCYAVRFVALPEALEDKLVAWVFRQETLLLRKRRAG